MSHDDVLKCNLTSLAERPAASLAAEKKMGVSNVPKLRGKKSLELFLRTFICLLLSKDIFSLLNCSLFVLKSLAETSCLVLPHYSTFHPFPSSHSSSSLFPSAPYLFLLLCHLPNRLKSRCLLFNPNHLSYWTHFAFQVIMSCIFNLSTSVFSVSYSYIWLPL